MAVSAPVRLWLAIAAWPILAGSNLGAPAHAAPNTPAEAAGGQTDEDEDAAVQAPLTVGSMAIASDASLVVESMAVNVSIDRITYAYKFKNRGKDKLALTASVAMPDLEVNNEGTTFYDLPSMSPQNPVDLTVQADDKPVQKTQYMQAVALGIDRLAELKAEHMPLIPFGPETEKAIGALKPETVAKLEALGLLTPRDPAQPDTPVIADWSLHSVIGWTLEFEPNVSSNVTVAFTPVKAVYTIDASSLSGFDALKSQVCLTPQIMGAAWAMLKEKGSTVDVADITLANDGPARWLDNPPATVAVRKPTPDAVIAFCGMDGATQKNDVVAGKMPGSAEAAGLRVLVFTRHAKK